jgi:hypothetical protein
MKTINRRESATGSSEMLRNVAGVDQGEMYRKISAAAEFYRLEGTGATPLFRAESDYWSRSNCLQCGFGQKCIPAGINRGFPGMTPMARGIT